MIKSFSSFVFYNTNAVIVCKRVWYVHMCRLGGYISFMENSLLTEHLPDVE